MKSDLFLERVADSIIKRQSGLKFNIVLKEITDILLNDKAWLKVLNQINKIER